MSKDECVATDANGPRDLRAEAVLSVDLIGPAGTAGGVGDLRIERVPVHDQADSLAVLRISPVDPHHHRIVRVPTVEGGLCFALQAL